MKAALLLTALYLAAVVDVVTGLNFNFYGYGREPLAFAISTVLVAIGFYALGRFWLGMIALALCCAWLLLYPSKNGFDVVLSPLLCLAMAMWVRQKFKTKK